MLRAFAALQSPSFMGMCHSRSEQEQEYIQRVVEGGSRLPYDARRQVPDFSYILNFCYAPIFWLICGGSLHDKPDHVAEGLQIRTDPRATGRQAG